MKKNQKGQQIKEKNIRRRKQKEEKPKNISIISNSSIVLCSVTIVEISTMVYVVPVHIAYKF